MGYARLGRLGTVTLVGALALTACRDAAVTTPEAPLQVIPDLLSTAAMGSGTTFAASAYAITEYKLPGGTWTRDSSEAWIMSGVMSDKGIARLTSGTMPPVPRPTATDVDLRAYLAHATPVIALAGSATSSAFYTGFARTGIDSSGARLAVSASKGEKGAPIKEIEIRRNGVLVASVELVWTPTAGGYVLTQQTNKLYRGPNAELFAVMVIHITYTAIEPQGLAARLTRVMFRYAASMIFPQPLYAQDCAVGVVKTTAGFVALVATAPAVTTGAGAVAWVAGWVSWTAGLVDTVDSCDS